ncbi:NPCBM/NEW2 domain-containing protein [Uliginosibacterium sp. H1]|uniref:NPCBM/NEW2 domain-containing protein n=1 Tax=Uliginosibacterium sp. H1 TaxID=3114757 RepID=UPI002E19E09B|nr:NPCBM/NEW2 domain-containing protein [Uliginosibacterium sp. H1]
MSAPMFSPLQDRLIAPLRRMPAQDIGYWLMTVVLVLFALWGMHTLKSQAERRVMDGEWIDLNRLSGVKISQGYGNPRMDRSTDDNNLLVAGRAYERGVGTHAPSTITLPVPARAQSFTAYVGLDDEAPGGEVAFEVRGDGHTLWRSGVVKSGQQAVPVNVPVQGVKELELVVDSLTDQDFDHADWLNPGFRLGAPGS